MANPRPELSLVIAVHDEEATIARLEDRLLKFAPGAEIVFVDDASRDRSLAYLRSLAARDARFRILALARHVGHDRALAAGLDHARGRAVITMGLDQSAQTVQQLVEKWREGFDVVYVRAPRMPTDGGLTKLAAKIYDGLMSDLVPVGAQLDTGGVRLVSRRVVKRLRRMPDRHRPGMAAWVGFRQAAIESHEAGRPRTFGLLLRGIIDGLVTHSGAPLRIAMYVGLGLFAVVVVFVLGMLIYLIAKHTLSSWMLTTALLGFFSSLNLVALGMIGGYVTRLAEDVRRRPLYVTAERINFGRMRPRAPTADFASAGVVEVNAAAPSIRPPPQPVQNAPTPPPPPVPQAAPSRPPPNVLAGPAPSHLGSKPPPALPSKTKTMMGVTPAPVPKVAPSFPPVVAQPPPPAPPVPPAKPSKPPELGTMAGLGEAPVKPSNPPPAALGSTMPLAAHPPPPAPTVRTSGSLPTTPGFSSASVPSAAPATNPDPAPRDSGSDLAWDSTEAVAVPSTVASPPPVVSARSTQIDADEEKTSDEKAPDSTPTAVSTNQVPADAIRSPFESHMDEDSPTRVGPPPSTAKPE